MSEILNSIKFDDRGLIPVIAQDHSTNEVLMMAYMNKEALEKSLETGKVHYFSRSRNKLWQKGETSGHYQYIKSIKVDCDGDALLIKVEQVEGACHTGHFSCFYREISDEGLKETQKKVFDEKEVYDGSKVLKEVYDVIVDRTINPKEGSYTNYLFEKGLDKILKKVGEEASEVIIAAKNKDKGEIVYEISDLFYHLFVLMVERGVKLEDIYNELKKRR
ncbi:bifunctional phosphoribosyl-AMP cyclohydrolase/phosphoribosyl-ATP diphosphatase HisIE [Acetivibrio saccincola]|nr:bifunctional phosphoribosyl-AMP cyclohydrolase/phosphoribosyl-ATP diphosphatase HisIE [Acetivibrio saccincola]NLW26936.1 bifunctional phosphoribosyl-AMP cyclohydrolase/phosphoribosyl-ATP diphosphatase HisIE [Acetivibrio saccincola]PQQ68246.1 bifunctional phosphoribosyl-AMP cyclohydrolase/phosphoribosyl-ATP diphosphatase [Acetivibrio saccincola]HOA96375.1 bifunctional phosphoribosyl-AMP cyclohydrolase/phosphoribosyl-ATP diphosphatase HisIE [Acetivibrio saccincola]HQD28861.1 bifunctional phosp